MAVFFLFEVLPKEHISRRRLSLAWYTLGLLLLHRLLLGS